MGLVQRRDKGIIYGCSSFYRCYGGYGCGLITSLDWLSFRNLSKLDKLELIFTADIMPKLTPYFFISKTGFLIPNGNKIDYEDLSDVMNCVASFIFI